MQGIFLWGPQDFPERDKMYHMSKNVHLWPDSADRARRIKDTGVSLGGKQSPHRDINGSQKAGGRKKVWDTEHAGWSNPLRKVTPADSAVGVLDRDVFALPEISFPQRTLLCGSGMSSKTQKSLVSPSSLPRPWGSYFFR